MAVVTSPLISRIVLDFDDAHSLFDGCNVSNLREIDCSRISSGEYMFRGATLSPELNLVSTAKTKNMQQMFCKAKNLRKLTGLDTRSAVSMAWFMCDLSSFRERAIVLPELNLANC